jgi:hypothetical protein
MHYQPALAYPALRLGTKEKLLALLIIASLLLQSLAGMMPPVVVRPALEQTTVARLHRRYRNRRLVHRPMPCRRSWPANLKCRPCAP